MAMQRSGLQKTTSYNMTIRRFPHYPTVQTESSGNVSRQKVSMNKTQVHGGFTIQNALVKLPTCESLCHQLRELMHFRGTQTEWLIEGDTTRAVDWRLFTLRGTCPVSWRQTTSPDLRHLLPNAIFKSNSVKFIISYHFISFDIVSSNVSSQFFSHPQILPQLEPLLSHEFQARTTELHQLLGSNDSRPATRNIMTSMSSGRDFLQGKNALSIFLKCHYNIEKYIVISQNY